MTASRSGGFQAADLNKRQSGDRRSLIHNYGVRSGAFCNLNGNAWLLGCAITGGR